MVIARPISSDKAAMWSLLALALMIQFGLAEAVQTLTAEWNVRQVWAVVGACAAFLVVGAYRESSVLDSIFAWRGTSMGWLAFSAGVGGMMAMFVRARSDLLRPVSSDAMVLSTTMGPLMEELVYRGFLWGVLNDLFAPIRGGIALVIVACCSATLFALAHANPSVAYFWLRFGAGLVNGLLRARSDSSLPPAAAHLAFNICMVS